MVPILMKGYERERSSTARSLAVTMPVIFFSLDRTAHQVELLNRW